MSLLYKPENQRPVAVERRPRRRAPSGTDRAELGIGIGVAVVLAALTLYLGFNAGGFFAGTTAVVTIALSLLSAICLLFLPRPLGNLTPALLVPLALLAGFAAWTLGSATWSGGSARALIEFDRALLYVLVLVFFGCHRRRQGQARLGDRGLAAAAVAICAAGWMTRVAADVWPIALDVRPERLSFPLTYWNALGLLAALGLVACAYLSSSRREARLTGILAAAATPLLASTLLLTYSRASLLLVPLGLLVYARGRPPAALDLDRARRRPAGRGRGRGQLPRRGDLLGHVRLPGRDHRGARARRDRDRLHARRRRPAGPADVAGGQPPGRVDPTASSTCAGRSGRSGPSPPCCSSPSSRSAGPPG